MKTRFLRPAMAVVFLTASALAGGVAFAQLAPNQTMGFANGKLATFTYTQNYDCVDEPGDDLDFNTALAQVDSPEMQTPICVPAMEPSIDPTGRKIKKTAHLYVLVPMFSGTNDTNPANAMACPGTPRTGELCGSALGSALISLFGVLPEAWEATPSVPVQCPNPTSPAGTCTMHTTNIDLSQVGAALGLPAPFTNPATANVFVPEPNHTHVIDNGRINTKKPIWWEVRAVLINDQSDWPAADGSSGITSVKAMDAAEKAGRAIEVGSNFFLFFSSQKNKGGAASMAGMPGM